MHFAYKMHCDKPLCQHCLRLRLSVKCWNVPWTQEHAIDLCFASFYLFFLPTLKSAHIQPQVMCSQPYLKLDSIKSTLICKKAWKGIWEWSVYFSQNLMLLCSLHKVIVQCRAIKSKSLFYWIFSWGKWFHAAERLLLKLSTQSCVISQDASENWSKTCL